MPDDARQRLAAQPLGGGSTHQHQRGGTVVDRGARCRRDGAVFLEGGLELRDFVELDFARPLILADDALAGAVLDRDRRDLGGKRPTDGGLLRALTEAVAKASCCSRVNWYWATQSSPNVPIERPAS